MHRRSLLGAAAVMAFGARAVRARAAQPRPLRIGVTAVILSDQAAFLARWADHLSQRIGVPLSFMARDEYQPILDLLLDKQLDAAWICGYPYVRHQQRLRLLAAPLYQGRPLYQSYLIRATAGNARPSSWADLRGKVLAYSDPLSNSGWLVAQGRLAAAGLKPDDLRHTFFAHGHRNVAEAVAAQLADAGAIDGYVWETMRQLNMPAAMQTEVLWKSPLYGFPPIVSVAAQHSAVHDALQKALLVMPDDATGRALLADLNLDGFVPAEPALFESVQQLLDVVRGSRLAA